MGKKKSRTHKTSSGKRRRRTANRQIKDLIIKINRWEKNADKPSKRSAGKSRHGWNTKKMKAHLGKLKGTFDKGLKMWGGK